MEIFMILVGVGIIIFSLISIHNENKKLDKKTELIGNYERNILNIKKDIEEIEKKSKDTSQDKVKELEKLLKECDRRILIFDNKIKEGYGLNAILERNYEKTSELQVTFKAPEKQEYSKEDILELYKNGISLKEISEITGYSLKEIASIMEL